MKYLADVVAEAVGTDNPLEVEAIVASSEEAVVGRLVSLHRQWKPKTPPVKRIDEFVPGWRIDPSDRPSGSDVYFVLRAILYAHRIALKDPLYFHLHPLSGWEPNGGWGFKESLAKVLFYGPLERLGILFYLPPGTPPEPEDFFQMGHTDEVLEQYFRYYLAPTGHYLRVADEDWGHDTVDTRLARNVAEVQLGAGLYEATTVLEWQRANEKYIDLWVPERRSNRDAIEWMIRQRGAGLLTGKVDSADSQTMRALWDLPVPSEERFGELSLKDLVSIRDEKSFAAWRKALTSALDGYVASRAVYDDAKAVKQFSLELDARRLETIRAARSNRLFTDMVGPAGKFGISAIVSAGVSEALAVDPWAGTAVGAAGALAVSTPKVVRVVKSLAGTGGRVKAVEKIFDLFGTS